jgi:uncharacterized RDD family membrane protein YckC
MLLLLVAVAAFFVAVLAKERRRQWQMLTDRAIAAGESVPARLTPFWRRLAAFALDLLLLGAVGEVVRAAFSDPMRHFGDHRRLFAWAVVIIYFGCFESRLGRGRSIGKRLLDICVIRPDNTYLSPVEAGLRAALVTAPAIFNGANYESVIAGTLLGVVVFGLPLSMLYLLALTNNERQVLLHDLAFGTLVVRQEDRDLQRPPPVAVPLWRGHLVVVSLILLTSLLLTPFTMLYFASE